MASTQRQTSTDLDTRRVSDICQHSSFFELVRHFERLDKFRATNKQGQQLGADNSPKHEPLRFHAVNHMGFASNCVEQVKLRQSDGEGDPKYDMYVNNYGLTGPTGVLPAHYTQLLQTRIKQNDHAFNDFLDMFNHRLISLFYRAWKKYRIEADIEDNRGNEANSPVTRAIQSLAGQYAKLSYETPLFYSGHYARKVRTASSLKSILEDHLKYKVDIRSFEGRWIPIKTKDRLCIGSRNKGFNNKLGEGVLPGNRAWDVQGQCGITVGPLTYSEYENLLPDKVSFKELKRLLKSYVPSHLIIKLNFIIRDRSENKQQPLGSSLRLGWNAWLDSQENTQRQATITIT